MRRALAKSCSIAASLRSPIASSGVIGGHRHDVRPLNWGRTSRAQMSGSKAFAAELRAAPELSDSSKKSRGSPPHALAHVREARRAVTCFC
jgi:hypothetical protein